MAISDTPEDPKKLLKKFRALEREHTDLQVRHALATSSPAKAGKAKLQAAAANVPAGGQVFSESAILKGIREIIQDITQENDLRKPSALALGANVMESTLVDRINAQFLNSAPSKRVLNSIGSSETISHLAHRVFVTQTL